MVGRWAQWATWSLEATDVVVGGEGVAVATCAVGGRAIGAVGDNTRHFGGGGGSNARGRLLKSKDMSKVSER